jgi:hypothetical protein
MAQVVECLSIKCEALSSNHSTEKKVEYGYFYSWEVFFGFFYMSRSNLTYWVLFHLL